MEFHFCLFILCFCLVKMFSLFSSLDKEKPLFCGCREALVALTANSDLVLYKSLASSHSLFLPPFLSLHPCWPLPSLSYASIPSTFPFPTCLPSCLCMPLCDAAVGRGQKSGTCPRASAAPLPVLLSPLLTPCPVLLIPAELIMI